MVEDQAPRIGYIGAGWTDRVQIPAFTLGGLQPQAISSGHIANAQRVAKAHNIPEVYATWQELVAAPNVDIVSIVTPPDTHKEIAVAALQAGKHVICEKPMALNVGEAEAMFAAAQAAPGQLAIIDHELRFHPLRMQMRQMIKEGAIGTVLRIELERLGPDRLDAGKAFTWWSDAARGGGMLNAVGSHLIDQARWCVGRIDGVAGQLQVGHYTRANAEGHMQQVTADDHVDILVRFSHGIQGRIVASGLTPGGFGINTFVVGTEGALKLDNHEQLWHQAGLQGSGASWEPVRSKYPVADLSALPPNNPFAIGSFYLAQTLAASLPMGETALPDAASFYDGLVVQRTLDGVRASHRDSTWVAL
jgi:predicted dehydrogenase